MWPISTRVNKPENDDPMHSRAHRRPLRDSGVKVEGALSDYTSRAASGNLMHRQFCPTCGTPVFTQSDARRHMIGVRAGTLDDPEIGKPQITIWTSSAPSWAVFDPNIPAG